MTFTIGRASFTNAPSAIRHTGDRVDIDIDILPASLVEAKVLRQQVLGLDSNDDEPVVPLTWSDDADYDGFYRVLGVDVEPVQAYLTNRLMRARLSVERVGGGYAEPTHELYAIGVKPNNVEFGSSALDEASSAVYLPSSFTSQSMTPATTTGRTASDGNGFIEAGTAFVADGDAITFAWTHTATPADYYDAACVVERSVSGSWYTVVGQQTPSASTLRVGNGLVRVSVASDGTITVESWDGAAWRSKDYDITYDTGAGNITAINSVSVWVNAPDACVVAWRGKTDDDGGVTIAARVVRGSLLAEVSVASNAAQVWKLTRSTTEAGTVINDLDTQAVGVRATSNDANGDRYVIVSRQDLASGSADTTNGGWTSGITQDPSNPSDASGVPLVASGLTSTAAVWGVGLEVNGSSATSPNNAATMAERFQVVWTLSRTV